MNSKLNRQELEAKEREKNIGKLSKWEEFRVRRTNAIDAYLVMKKL